MYHPKAYPVNKRGSLDYMDTLVNGMPGAAISIHDRGLQFGDGVFETIAVRSGKLLCRDAHFTRLETGCRQLSINCPDRNLLEREADRLCESLPSAVLKIIITRGAGGRGYQAPENTPANRILSVHQRPVYPSNYYRDGIDSHVCSRRISHQPELAGIKHLNRLEQVLLRREVTAARYPEGVVLDPDNNVVEGSMSNIFMVKNAELITPDLSRCGVAGVIRKSIIELDKAAGRETGIRTIAREELFEADEVFYCNSVIGIWPVRRIGDKAFNSIDAGLEIMEKLITDNRIVPVT